MRKIKSALPPGDEPDEFVLSDNSVDRMGDIVEPSGWQLDFKSPPPVLYNHKSDQQVGAWTDVRVENNRLVGRIKWTTSDWPLAKHVRHLVREGLLRTVSVGFAPEDSEPINKDKPYGGQRYLKQSLLECSLVSVPANPNSIAIARSLHLSDDLLSLAFGEHAVGRPAEERPTGKQAVMKSHERSKPMTTLSERIEHTQTELNGLRDRLDAVGAELSIDDLAELNNQIDQRGRDLSVLKDAEARNGAATITTTALAKYTAPVTNVATVSTKPAVAAPAISRMPLGQKELNPVELLSRVLAINVVARGMRVPPEMLCEKVFGRDECTKAAFNIVAKAASAAALTTVTGWATELVQPLFTDLMPTLLPQSVYNPLSTMGMRLTFGRYGAINIPTRSLSTTIAGSFVQEGSPIPVRQGLFTTQQLVPKKMAVISSFSREMTEHSIPSITALVQEAIQQDTTNAIDAILLDNNAKTSVRPAGIRNGVSGQTPTAGGGFTAMVGDLKNLIGSVLTTTSNNLRSPVWLMNPAQKLSLMMMQPTTATPLFPFAQQVENNMLMGYPIIVSGNVTAAMVILLDAADYVSATDDSPRFEASDQTTLHMEDTNPVNIGTAGAPATVAAPAQSMFQTDCIALRMILPMDWLMRRASVAWVASVTW